MNDSNSTKSYIELIEEFNKKGTDVSGEKLIFEGFGDNIIYNCTAPFEIYIPALNSKVKILFARVESTESFWLGPITEPKIVWDPQITPCIEKNGIWHRLNEREIGLNDGDLTFKFIEDPFFSFINDEFVLGGVTLDFENLKSNSTPTIHTEFYKGSGIHDLKKFADIKDMKDIRLISLPNKEIVVLTRPQGGDAGLGTIGITKIKSLEELTQSNVENAILIKNQISPDSKLGANEIYVLGNAHKIELGVLGHIANVDAQNALHYSAIVFKITNPETFEVDGVKTTPIQVIATRVNWPEGITKFPLFNDVVFPTGLVFENNKAKLYAGLSDAEQGVITIDNPFL